MSNMILKDDCSYSYIKLQCSLYNEDKKALEQIKLSRTGEESINNLKSKFTNNETPLYSIFQEIAQEYSYNHVYLIPPCSQPFVNIYPEECGFFEFMQQLYNEEIDTKHRRLWECELIKKEDLLLDVRIENRTKRFKKDSRKACIFIGKKEQVLTFVNFINEQLEVMDQLTKTKINYNHSKVRIEDINNIIEELNPRVVSSKDNASNGSNSRYEESKESKEETKEESIGCNDLLETPLGSSSQTKFFTRRTRGARERPYGFFLLSNPKNAEILIYALISDQYKLYWEDRLRGMEDVTLPDSLSNSPENFMTCEKCQVLLEERLCEERLRDINFTQAFRPENKEIFLNTQDRINQSLRKHVYPGFFNKVVVHDTSITWKTICKRKERKEKEREFYNTINKIAEEQDMGRKIIKISPDEELIEIRENIKACIGMGIYPILSKFYAMCQDPEIKEEKSPGSCCIIEDRDMKSRIRWYLRMRDGTLHNKFNSEESATLDKKHKEFLHDPNRYNGIIKNSIISVRGVKYDQVLFNKNYKENDIEVGELINLDGTQADNNNPNLGSKLIRIAAKKIIGQEKDVVDFYQRFEEFYKSEFGHEIPVKNKMIYDILIKMHEDDLKNLFTQLVLEAGIVLKVKSGACVISLGGIYPTKAISLIYFNPLIQFRIRQLKSIYPPLWEQTEINEKRIEGKFKDRVYNAYRLPLMVEKKVVLSNASEEYTKVEEYFFKNMNKERFVVVEISRIQLPREYKTYFFNREYFIEKKEIYNERKRKGNEENKFQQDQKAKAREQEKYEKYYPFDVEEEGNAGFIFEEENPKEENKEENKQDSEEEIIGQDEEEKKQRKDKKIDDREYIDLCRNGEKFLFYVPRTTLKKKIKDDAIQEYQTIDECIEEKGILPIHTKNAEIDDPDWKITHGHQTRSNKKKNIQGEENRNGKLRRAADSSNSDSDINDDLEDSDNEREFDSMTLFGDDAAYFTVNTDPDNPTMLYSHNEACKDISKNEGRRYGYRQLLCKVITGIEADYSERIGEEIKNDANLRNIDEMMERGRSNELRKPEYPYENNNQTTTPDCNMISIPKILNIDQQNRGYQEYGANEAEGDEEVKHFEEDKEAKDRRLNIINRILPKNDEESACKFCNEVQCECFKSAELYSIYAKNRCYMAYDIHYRDREEY